MIYMVGPNCESFYCIDGWFLPFIAVGNLHIFTIPVQFRERLQNIGFGEVANPAP